MVEQVLVLIKPDGMVKSLVGNILSILAESKLKIVGAKIVRVKKEFAEKHYERHKGKPFYDELINYITGNLQFHTNRVLAIVYEGEDAIEKIRTLVGNKNPENADPKSIRGKYGRINSKTGVYENVLHASDEASEAEREIKLWFKPFELANVIFKTKEVEVKKTELDWA
jgi:nucleoside-diphosphate kinase